jgi:hypothetical protein
MVMQKIGIAERHGKNHLLCPAARPIGRIIELTAVKQCIEAYIKQVITSGIPKCIACERDVYAVQTYQHERADVNPYDPST